MRAGLVLCLPLAFGAAQPGDARASASPAARTDAPVWNRAPLPAGSLARVGELGSVAFLHVHTHVRDDAIVLYGFPSRDERICFEALIAAHGVGPAVALALLSVHSPLALAVCHLSGAPLRAAVAASIGGAP